MANLFVLNVDGMIAPWAADKNANRLIAIAVERLAGSGMSAEAVDNQGAHSLSFLHQ